MKRNYLAMLMAMLILALLFGCRNNRNQGEDINYDNCFSQTTGESWDDREKLWDSLWSVYSESTNEEEVNKAREILYDMACQAELNEIVEHEYEKYKAHVEAEFQQLLLAFPEYSSLFCKEKEKWESYHEAVLTVISQENHGSSGTLNIIGALNQSVDLWSASFHNLWMYKQDQDVSSPHTKFTSRMIDDAYTSFFNVSADNWYNIYTEDPKEGIEEYKESISNERKLWNNWMDIRTTIAKALPKDLRKIYNGCTNLTMRTKLHQLKNQNAGLGLMSDDVSDCLLPDSCSDKALLEYPGLNVVLEKHSADLNWYPTFE